MPWKPSDAEGHTKSADSPEKKARWADIANKVLDQTRDEGRAIRTANAAVEPKKQD